jgi:ectoine hydroxylase-related dioxygenase (phytanoyl-CoA dioxygenase family)
MPLLRDLIFQPSCEYIEHLRDGIKELRYDKSFYSRQGDLQEPNILTKGGLISNGFLGIHATDNNLAFYVKEICTSKQVGDHLRRNYGFSDWKLVQTMLFDSNPITSLHTDDIFLDSSTRGRLVGMLISLEDMTSSSGGITLFNYSLSEIDNLYNPITASIDLEDISSSEDVYKARGLYLKALKNHVKESKKESVYLSSGEVVSWSSYIPHESLRGDDDYHVSRRSIAAHFIPAHMNFTCLLGDKATSYAERFRVKSFLVK